MRKNRQTTVFRIGDTVYYALEIDRFIPHNGKINKGIIIGNGCGHLYNDENERVTEFLLVKNCDRLKETHTIYIKKVPVLEKKIRRRC